MKTVSIEKHDFQKVNLVTTAKGDLYKCSVCGVSGYRAGIAPIIVLSDSEYRKSTKCSFKSSVSEVSLPKEVLTDDLPHVGLEYGVHAVVDCPMEYQKYKNDVWVFSKKRNEPVRLFPHEYEIVTQ